jgi:hypothetical protein
MLLCTASRLSPGRRGVTILSGGRDIFVTFVAFFAGGSLLASAIEYPNEKNILPAKRFESGF